MNNVFKTRLHAGDLLIGTLVTLPAPEIAEIMAAVGYDWLFIDTEHGAFDAAGAQPLLQAAGTRCPCVIRVPAQDEVWVKKALDIGAAGIIFPQVNSVAQAQRAVRLCKYPPQGVRGVGVARAHGYGTRFQEYIESANEAVAVIVQAEHVDAVRNIDAIAKVSGVDAVLVGPYDLSASLGHMGQVSHPDVQDAIARIAKACTDVGVPLGAFSVHSDAVRPFIAQGFTLIALGVDTLMLANAAKDALAGLRD